VEFLRMRPERRTAEMARDWWEGEVEILEKRKEEVDKERAALEAGVEVWTEAVKLVSEFESDLRKEMNGAGNAMTKIKGKGKEGDPPAPPTPEQTMYGQLDKMRAVMAGLEERLQITEENGWNLLICAIGAELEAFRQAESMLREALRAAGFDVGDGDGDQGDSTPHIGRSTSLRNSSHRLDGADHGGSGKLVDLHEDLDSREPESDNEVPPDLLVAPDEGHGLSPALSRESSNNEVPPEFLREHDPDDEYPGFGVMA
jgi:pyruvate kinase